MMLSRSLSIITSAAAVAITVLILLTSTPHPVQAGRGGSCAFSSVPRRRLNNDGYSSSRISLRRNKQAAAQQRIRRIAPRRLYASNHDDNEQDVYYDAIIIGSGMSGLIAGNYLTKNNRKVLMLDQHAIPGGYTSNFYRKGFRFEISTHLLSGCDAEGSIGKILRDFDVEQQIEFIKLKELLRWIDPAHGIDCVQPVGVESYVVQLCELFPDQQAGIRKFYDQYYPAVEFVVNYEMRRGLNQALYALLNLPAIFTLLSLKGKTAADILDPLVTDPVCKEIMTIMTALFGLHYSELDAAIFVMGSMMFHATGAYYPKGGSGKLSRALTNQFVNAGGELRLKTHVDEILFENGLATGVRTTRHHDKLPCTFKARCVINGSDLTTLVNRLCPEGTLPQSFVKNVQKRRPGNSLVLAWAGLDIDLRDYGIKDFEIMRSNNKSEQTKDIMDHVLATADYSELPVSEVTVYSNVDPSCCPPGKSVIATNFMASHDLFEHTLGPHGERTSPEYKKLKARVGDQLLQQMIKATGIPELAEHVEVMEVATPITFKRYTDNLGGSFMGWQPTPDQGAFSALTPKTPIKNLLVCGQWLGVGGVSSVMNYGLEAGKIAERYLQGTLGKGSARSYDPTTKHLSGMSG